LSAIKALLLIFISDCMSQELVTCQNRSMPIIYLVETELNLKKGLIFCIIWATI